MTRLERLQQRTAAGPPPLAERLRAQALTDRRGAVVQLDGQPGEERRVQGRAARRRRRSPPRAAPGPRGGQADHDRQTRALRAPRGRGARPSSARARGARSPRSSAGPVGLADAGARVAEREQQRRALRVREIQLRQSPVQERRGVLVAELGDRALGRAQHDLCDRGRLDERLGIEQVARQIRQSWLAPVRRLAPDAVGDPAVEQRLPRRRQAASTASRMSACAKW